MKLKHLILFLAVVLAACSTRHPVETRPGTSLPNNMVCQQLQAIDSLMWRQPDSALMVLVDFATTPKADSLSAFEGHYCQMLLSELLYKNDYEQTNREELLKAVDYFDSLTIVLNDTPQPRSRHCGLGPQSPGQNDNLVFLDARAHYINGVGYYERDSVVEACAEYLKALEAMGGQFDEKELVKNKAKFMAYTYNRLGDMFSGQFMMENAIICFENALSYCQIAPTSFYGISRIINCIGLQYAMLKDYDQAKRCYGQALEQMPDSNNVAYRDILSHIALCNYNLGLEVKRSIASLQQLYANGTSEKESATYALFLGSIYTDEQVYDSALLYLEPLFEHYGEIEAAKYLRVIYDSLGYAEKADECVRFLADNIQSEGENKALVSQLNQVFKRYLDKQQVQQVAQEKRNAVVKAMNWAVPIAIFLFTCFYFAAKYRKRKQMRTERSEYETQWDAVSERLRQANQEVNELSYPEKG